MGSRRDTDGTEVSLALAEVDFQGCRKPFCSVASLAVKSVFSLLSPVTVTVTEMLMIPYK